MKTNNESRWIHKRWGTTPLSFVREFFISPYENKTIKGGKT